VPEESVPLVATLTVAVVGRGGGVVNVTVAFPFLVTPPAVANAVTAAEPVVVALVRVTVATPLELVVVDAVLRVPPVEVNVTGTPESAVPV
jgi:hypothetical protein